MSDLLVIAMMMALVTAVVALGALVVGACVLAWQHVRLRRVSRELVERTFVRGRLGLVREVRGRLEGVHVTLDARTLTVFVASAFEGTLGHKELGEIARGERPLFARLARDTGARSAAERLAALTGRTVRVRIDSNRARIRGFPAGRTVEVAAALAALAGTRSLNLVRSSANATCPFCHDTLGMRETEGTIRCPDCDSLHHTPCWREHGGCAIHGCARTPGRADVVVVLDDAGREVARERTDAKAHA